MDDDPRPSPGFDGWQNREWDGDHWYERACTPDEAALLDAYEAAMTEAERRELDAYATADRDRFFNMLRSEIAIAASLPPAGEGLGRGDADAKAAQ